MILNIAHQSYDAKKSYDRLISLKILSKQDLLTCHALPTFNTVVEDLCD